MLIVVYPALGFNLLRHSLATYYAAFFGMIYFGLVLGYTVKKLLISIRKTMNTFDLTLRLLVGLVLLFIITKVLGKTQISQITPFDFIFSIVLGELFVHAVFAQHNGLFQLFYTLTLWGALIYLFELLAEKFLKLRGFLEGKPAIIVREGRIDRKQLQRNRLNLDQLLNLLRQNQVFALAEVKYAILEMNGSLSVLKYSGRIPIQEGPAVAGNARLSTSDPD